METQTINKHDLKQVAKYIRETIKKEHPDIKISVRKKEYTGGGSITIIILESKKIRFIRNIEEIKKQEYWVLKARKQAYNDNLTEEEAEEYFKKKLEYEKKYLNLGFSDEHIEEEILITEKGKEKLKQILKIIKKYHYDNSDAMIDYFDTNYYIHFSLGYYDKPFIDGKN